MSDKFHAGSDFVKKAAREAAELAYQAWVSTQGDNNKDPNWFIGQVNPTKDKITHPNGNQYNLVFTGQVTDYCLAYIVDSNTAYGLGQEKNRVLNTDNKLSKGYMVIGGWTGPLTLYNFNNYSTAPPAFGIVDIQDQTNKWYLPYPPDSQATFRIYDIIATNNPGGTPYTGSGYDGLYYAQLKSDFSELVIVRLSLHNSGFQINGNVILPTCDVRYSYFKGLGLDNTHQKITWTSLDEGSLTINYPGTVYGGINQTYTLCVFPVISWDSSGTLIIDGIGSWSAGDNVPTDFSTGWFVTPILNSSSSVNVSHYIAQSDPNTTTNLIGFSYPESVFYLNDSFNPNHGSGFRSSSGTTASALTYIIYPGDPNGPADMYGSPYGTLGTNLDTITSSYQDTVVAYDSLRYYKNNTLWSDIFYDPVINPTPTLGFLKTKDNEQFIIVRTISTHTWSLTNYSWNSTNSSIIKGKEITGNTLTFSSSPFYSNSFSIMDWLIQ